MNCLSNIAFCYYFTTSVMLLTTTWTWFVQHVRLLQRREFWDDLSVRWQRRRHSLQAGARDWETHRQVICLSRRLRRTIHVRIIQHSFFCSYSFLSNTK